MADLSPRKKLAFALVLLLAGWGLVELACWAGLVYLVRAKGLAYRPALVRSLEAKHRGALENHLADASSYMVYDSELGWAIRPHGARGGFVANGQGLRGGRDYAPEPPPDRVRVAAFGDSFTHSTAVPNGFTWEEVLEQLAPGLEVLNFGVPAYGLDQAYLRYRSRGVDFHPAVVLIGFMSENVHRGINTFRPFYFPESGMAFAKPRFVLRGDALELLPNPMLRLEDYRELVRDPAAVLPRLGEHDFYYQRDSARPRLELLPSVRFAWVVSRPWFEEPIELEDGRYNTAGEAYRVALATCQVFACDVLEHGALPLFVLFPDRHDLRAAVEGRPLSYQPLAADLAARGFRVLDLAEAFARYDPQHEMLQRNFLHYPKSGYRMVAKYLHDELGAAGLGRREGVEAERALLAARLAERPQGGCPIRLAIPGASSADSR